MSHLHIFWETIKTISFSLIVMITLYFKQENHDDDFDDYDNDDDDDDDDDDDNDDVDGT